MEKLTVGHSKISLAQKLQHSFLNALMSKIYNNVVNTSNENKIKDKFCKYIEINVSKNYTMAKIWCNKKFLTQTCEKNIYKT